MLKVVIHTNVFISAFYLPGSIPAEVVLLARRKKIANFISLSILNEISRIMLQKLSWDNQRTQNARQRIEHFSELVNPDTYLTVLNDGPDNRILECAIQAQADYIISGDKHLLNLKNYHWIKIVTPTAFLELVVK